MPACFALVALAAGRWWRGSSSHPGAGERQPWTFIKTIENLKIEGQEVQTKTKTRGHEVSFEIDGKTVTLKTGRMAKQANGACEVSCGDTMLLVTCTESSKVREGIDYFPLLVDYEEKLYSVGRIPGSFTRREAKPPDKAILISRLIDRPIRDRKSVV